MIYYFKNKWNLSSFVARKTKKARTCSNDIIKKFFNECRIAYENYGPSLLFNLDETFFRLLNGPIYSIGITGSDHRNVIIGCDDKNGFTSVFLVSACGKFYDPIVIMKGKTDKCLEKTEMVNSNVLILKYSPEGWITIDILKFIFQYIYSLALGQKCALILDSYTVHTDKSIKESSIEFNIELIYVPNGRTAENQPLDVSINGVIKAISSKLIREIYIENPYSTIKISDALKCLLRAKDQISSKLIIKAFAQGCNL